MVSADNLNLDVLELIFAHLAWKDLPSIALASRSFFAGVIPRLYCTLRFRSWHATRYPAVMSPFAVIVTHPELAINVRHVDIRAVPLVKQQHNPKFILECIRALDLCTNMMSFRCSTNSLPPFIPSLQQKDRLRDLRIHADLTTEQSVEVARLSKICHLTLEFPSWNILNLLPQWSTSLQGNLTTLTLYMASQLNETVFESVMAELPGLLGLHVIGCSKVDHVSVLSLVSYTPHLESLSMTTGEGNRALPSPPPPLASLRNLAIDTRPSAVLLAGTAVLSEIISYIGDSSPSLVSLVMAIPHRFVKQLIAAHASTLKSVSFLACTLDTADSLPALCRGCVKLERLEISIPARDWSDYAIALSKSGTLRTLVDWASHAHGLRPTLAQDNVHRVMARVPSLNTIASDGRIWTRRKDAQGGLVVGLELRPMHSAGINLFMPRESWR